MEQPLISMIVGIYNGERYLAACIQSIIEQDYPYLEIILIDDGSTDASGAIADEFATRDKRIIVVHQENAGVSTSRNKALEMSHGEYVCIIDQDDTLSKDYVSYFYGLIRQYGVEIALTPTADKFFEQENEDSLKTKKNDTVNTLTGEETAIEMLYHKIIIAPWNKMIKRELIVKNNVIFNTKFYGGEGFAFSIQCYQYASTIAVGQRKVYHYRVGDPQSGASKFRLSSIHSTIEAQKFIKETFVSPTPALMKAWKFSKWHSYCDSFNMMVGCGVKEKYVELYNEIKAVCRKEAWRAFVAPISLQQKFRGLLFMLSPYLAARVINHFRIRKFAKE